ncbi:MFS transporter [Bordetella genomosp. 10]|uniref:MFS transporter n=1 Tax=Bordetella genomosp. 10 TaxID=1416804 RepID=A0A261SA16_9BORD|nr:MFS transporter [Bordetella genomosp. 10]OZI34186.1 MFS transporter [Bordetella genomosp. 10]
MEAANRSAGAAPESAHDRIGLALLAVALAYVSLGVILGFVQGGIAPILRTQGMALSTMRWVYALYLPFGIAFLWAPVVDSWRWPWLGRRTGWIIPMQWVAVFAILAAAFHEPAHGAWSTLLILGVVATLAAATMDVALDALTVEMIPQAQRPAAAAAKMGGVSLGSVLGGGVLIALYPQLAWQGTMWVIAALMALSGVPVLALIRRDRQLSIQSTQSIQSIQSIRSRRQRASIRQTLRKPGMKTRFIRLTLLVCTLLALFNFNRLLLVDMGVSLERIGSVLGTIAPLANAAACVLAPFLVRWLPLRNAASLMAAVCLVSAGTVWVGFSQGSAMTAMIGSVLTTAGASALYVVLGGLILEWATGDQAATDYALLYGLGRFIGTAALLVLPGLIQVIGWSRFQACIVIAFAASAWYFMRMFHGPAAKAGSEP